MYQQNNYQQPQQLPCSATVVYTPNYMHSLPDNPTTYPTIPLSPNMSNYIRLIAGFTIKELQDNSSKNPLRIFSFNFFSSNNWSSPEFAQLMSMVADYAEFLVCTQQAGSVQQAIAMSASTMVTGMSAIMTSKFPALAAYVTPDLAPDLQNLMNNFSSVLNTLQQFKSRMQQPPPQQNNWNNQNQNPNFGGNFNNQQFINNNNGSGGFGVAMGGPSPNDNAFANTGSMFSAAPRQGAVIEGNIGTAMIPSLGNHTPIDISRPDVVEIGFSPNAAPVIETKQVKQKVYPARTSYQNMILAFIPETSAIKRKWSTTNPYSFAFDKSRHVMFLNMVDNESALEVIKPISEVGVEYINHELDPNFQLKVFQSSLQVNKDIPISLDRLQNPTPVKQIESNEQRDKELELKNAVYLHERHYAGSLGQAIAIAKMKLEEKQIKLSDSTPLAFTYRQIHPFYIDSKFKETIKEIKPLLKEILSYNDAYNFLNNVNGLIPTEIWNYLNGRLTSSVTRELTKGMGLKMRIENFYTDFHVMIDSLDQKGTGVRVTFLKTQENVVGTIFKVIVGDGLQRYMNFVGGTYTEESEFNNLIFFKDYYVTLVPWTSDKMEIAMKEQNGAVMESLFPDLFPVLKNIVDKSNLQKINRRLIVTADGIKIDVAEATFSKDVYIISQV